MLNDSSHLYLVLVLLAVVACSSSTTTTRHTMHHPPTTTTTTEQFEADGKTLKNRIIVEHKEAHEETQETNSASSQLFTEHGTSTEANAAGGKASNKRQPKTAAEIDAENRASQNRWLFWLGLGGMIFCAIGWGAKMAGVATFGTNMILNALASVPTFVLNTAGVAGAAAFAWSMLPEGMQMAIAGCTIAAVVVVVWISWKSSHEGYKARHELKKNGDS